MKIKSILLFTISFAIIFIFNSCKKSEDTSAGPMEFKFLGARDTSGIRGQTITRQLQVYYLGGDIESVTFSSSGEPAGVVISYEPDNAKPDSFVNQLIQISNNADTGIFILTATATGSGGKIFNKEYKLSISPAYNFPPSIQLTSGSPLNHQLNSPFVDPGYTASDIEDGDLSSQVRLYGSVNVDSAGQYKLHYAVTDSQGKTDSVTRIVIVRNDLSYLNGTYSVTTTDLQSGSSYNWITSIANSITVNNRSTIFKISDCYPANVEFDYNTTVDSIYLSTQTYVCKFGADSIAHTYLGSGKFVKVGIQTTITLLYTDTYFDSGLGSNVTINKRDIYTN